MGDHPDAAAARAALEAFKGGDLETMARAMAEDVVWHIPGSNRFSGEFRGKAAVLERFKAMGEAGVRASFDEIHDVVGNDEHVVALVRLSVAGGGGSASAGSTFVMHVRDGVMQEFWAMNDNQAAIDGVIG